MWAGVDDCVFGADDCRTDVRHAAHGDIIDTYTVAAAVGPIATPERPLSVVSLIIDRPAYVKRRQIIAWSMYMYMYVAICCLHIWTSSIWCSNQENIVKYTSWCIFIYLEMPRDVCSVVCPSHLHTCLLSLQGLLSLPSLRGRWMSTSYSWEGKGRYGSFRLRMNVWVCR